VKARASKFCVGNWRGSVFVAALLCIAGCSSKPVSREDEQTQDLNCIARAYGIIVNADHHAPKNVEEIKKLLSGLHKADIVPDPEEILVSTRDGQPYVIIYGVNLGMVAPSPEILAYEKKGAEGKRYVLLMSRDVRQITDEEFKQAKFANGHKPEA
jgi:hypothetical protein